MTQTLTENGERRAVFHSRLSVEEGASNEQSRASKDADIFRSRRYRDVAEWALKTGVSATEFEGLSEHEVALRRVKASAENLLAWGRSLARGEGDKVDVDI